MHHTHDDLLDQFGPAQRGRSVLLPEQRHLANGRDFSARPNAPLVKPLAGAVSGIGASSVAVVKIPPGATYTELILDCRKAAQAVPTRAEIESSFTGLRLLVSGVEKMNLSAAQLFAITEFHRTGITGASGFLIIPFQRLWMSTLEDKFGPALGTMGESSVQLEITQAGGTVITSINAWVRIAPVAEDIGVHMRFHRMTPNIAATGLFYFNDIPRQDGEYLAALHIQAATTNFANIALVVDNKVRLVDAAPLLFHQLYNAADPIKTPQTGWTHLDFLNRGFGGDYLDLGAMDALTLEINASAATGQTNVVAEIIVVPPEYRARMRAAG